MSPGFVTAAARLSVVFSCFLFSNLSFCLVHSFMHLLLFVFLFFRFGSCVTANRSIRTLHNECKYLPAAEHIYTMIIPVPCFHYHYHWYHYCFCHYYHFFILLSVLSSHQYATTTKKGIRALY